MEVQGTAEGQPFDEAALGALVKMARDGIAQLLERQREALRRAPQT